MPVFSNSEKTDMLLMLGRCNGNRRVAAVEYARKYQERQHPSASKILRIMQCLRRHGSFRAPYSRAVRQREQEPRDELILAAVQVQPHQSTRSIGQNLNTSHMTVWRSLKRHKYHPFHVHLHQALHGEDNLRRIEWCLFLREKLNADPDFLKCLLMSDEATFHRDGNVNLHNSHYWSATNPNWLRESNHQVRWKTNVWCGILVIV